MSEDSRTHPEPVDGASVKSSKSVSLSVSQTTSVKGIKTRKESKDQDMQNAINDINYGVAELIDIRMDVTKKTSDAL